MAAAAIGSSVRFDRRSRRSSRVAAADKVKLRLIMSAAITIRAGT